MESNGQLDSQSVVFLLSDELILCVCVCVHMWVGGLWVGWVVGQVDRWTDRWMDGWIDRRTDRQTDINRFHTS